MKKNLLTKHCALLLLALIATWSSKVWALTINVNVTGSQAPYVYAWDNNQTPLLDAYPGTQLTNIKKVGNKTWYYIDIDATSANLILSFGTDETKTGDITGITGNRYFEFANNNANNVTDYYDCPGGFEFEGSPFVYLVDTRNWANVYAYVWSGDNNNGWPGDKMQLIGTNGNGNKVYKWTSSNINFTPVNIKFNNVADNGNTVYEEGNNLGWTNGAFWSNYNWSYAMTVTGAALNSTYFPDTNLRKAITAFTGVAEGSVITPSNIIVLDISYDTSKGMTGKITDPTGIELFTALEELYSHNNSLTHLDLTHTSTLRILDVSGDNTLLGMRGVSYCNASGHGVNVKGNNNFKKLIADNCSAWAYNAGLGTNNNNFQYITSLEYISLKNCPLDDWSTGFDYQTGLKYLDLTNTGQKSTNGVPTVDVTHLTQLETLIVADNYKSGAHLGSVAGLAGLNHLKYFDMSNCDGNPHAIVATFTETQKGVLEYLDISNQHMTTTGADPAVNGFTALKTFKHNTQATWANGLSVKNCPLLETIDVNGNVKMTGLTIDNCPSLQEVIVTNNTSLPLLSITNSSLTTLPTITDLTSATSLTKIDLTGNAFTAVPTVGGNVTTMVLNNNQLTDIVAPSNIKYLYAQNNNFGNGDYTLPTTSLVGLDLGNNGFTKFKAENNTSLKSLALAGNTALTEIELHGNTALTQTSPDGVIETDNGLYIRGLSSLKVLNIEYSSFNKLGQQHSLQGLTGLKTLKARHNNFTTFTNGVYTVGKSGTGNYRITDPTESSLEYLTALEYLDLAYNNLRDSVHLYKNVNLKHLDVSHNRTIVAGGIYTNPNMTQAEKTAMRERKGRHLMKYGKVAGKAYGVTPNQTQWTNHYTNFQKKRSRPFDLRDCDLNDTTGLYHLDLGKNVNLEWLDFSYTNIHNTAAGPTYMCPGWMDKDWVTDIDDPSAVSSQNTQNQRAYVSWHTYVYFIPCSKLKVIHADHNNMCSLGYRYFPELDTLTCSYMYGDSERMRDFNSYNNPATSDEDLRLGMGNTGTQTKIKKFKSVTWGTNNDNEVTGTVVLEGPNGLTNDNSDFYPNKLRYYDISYSSFNEIRFYPGTADNGSLTNLEYVNVSGNPLNFQVHADDANYATTSNWNSLDVTYCPNIRTVLAENCADLPVVRAHNRTKLDTLYLSNDANLKTLYVQNDPLLKTNFQGLNTLTGLETLFGYNNTHWGNDITFASNTALKNLWISNIGASQLNLTTNKALQKLRAYDNILGSEDENRTIDLSNNTALEWLDLARNLIANIDLSHNTALQFVNFSNGNDTRIELDGTEQLNHDGSDGDGIKPTTVYSDSETPIQSADAGNSLSDLALPASITDARANGNDLHSITGNFANLTNMEFAHNHINGIDLSAAPGATIESRDNGRTILADCAKFSKKENGVVQEYTVYFFQLDPTVTGNGTVLTLKDSKDLKDATRFLGDDGLVMGNITWDGTSGSALKNTITPGDMSAIDPDDVPGNIVVLNPSSESGNGAEGTATYTYKTGKNSTSEFYLNWSSDGTVTGINEIKAEGGVSITNTYGNLTVAGADGVVVGVYDLNGRQVASETITGGKAVITGLTPGIYLVNGMKVLVK